MSTGQLSRIDACLVAGGKYHDIDFARRELLDLLAEHDNVRVRVAGDWNDLESLTTADFIVSYTCDVRPSPTAQDSLRAWIDGGGRLVAPTGAPARRW